MFLYLDSGISLKATRCYLHFLFSGLRRYGIEGGASIGVVSLKGLLVPGEAELLSQGKCPVPHYST